MKRLGLACWTPYWVDSRVESGIVGGSPCDCLCRMGLRRESFVRVASTCVDEPPRTEDDGRWDGRDGCKVAARCVE